MAEKPGHLLLRAFKAMNEPNGLTATQIIKFYSQTHNVPLQRATLAVQRALRMGLATGFVDKRRNRFVLGADEADRNQLLPALSRTPLETVTGADVSALGAGAMAAATKETQDDDDDDDEQFGVVKKRRKRRSVHRHRPTQHKRTHRKRSLQRRMVAYTGRKRRHSARTVSRRRARRSP